MIGVYTSFIFFSAIVFLGFILNGLFYKTKITNIIPLMIIGFIVGPILGFINTGPGSMVSQLAPYFTAIAIAFILFDVGLRIDFNSLKKSILISSFFTILVTIVIGLMLSAAAYYIFNWGLIISIIFGFACAGPSAVVVPTIVSMLNLSDDIKTLLVYESISSDVITLIPPLLLFGLLESGSISSSAAISISIYTVLSSVDIAIISALFWLYMLKQFKTARLDYGWMLTIAMVVATYGIASQIGGSGTITIFIFGLLISVFGSKVKEDKGLLSRKFGIPDTIEHIKGYQREIVFFASTFFFVYLGMLFNMKSLSYDNILLILTVFTFCIAIIIIRYFMTPIVNKLMTKEKRKRTLEHRVISFSIGRGLTVAVIASVAVSYNIQAPNFVNIMFLMILISNMIESAGIFILYRGEGRRQKDITNIAISNN